MLLIQVLEESKVVHRFSTAQGVRIPNSHVVQGSSVMCFQIWVDLTRLEGDSWCKCFLDHKKWFLECKNVASL